MASEQAVEGQGGQGFAPGFRFSVIDAVILLAAVPASVVLWGLHPWLGVACGFVTAHFFLFCNVLRMERGLELGWAAGFVGLAVAAEVLGWIGWPVALAVALGLTVVVARVQLHRPSYHGVAWQAVNPDLPEWWQRQRAGGG